MPLLLLLILPAIVLFCQGTEWIAGVSPETEQASAAANCVFDDADEDEDDDDDDIDDGHQGMVPRKSVVAFWALVRLAAACAAPAPSSVCSLELISCADARDLTRLPSRLILRI